MTLYLFNQDISNSLQRETVNYQMTLDIQSATGGSGHANLEFTLLIGANENIHPRTGNLITWFGDDGFNKKYFCGPIIQMDMTIDGKNEQGYNEWVYVITCQDASYLLEKQYLQPGRYNQAALTNVITTNERRVFGDAQTDITQTVIVTVPEFPAYFGTSYGQFMTILAQTADHRIRPAMGNVDSNRLLQQDYEFGRITFGQAITQLAQESGLIWWIDSDFKFHYKPYSAFLLQTPDSYYSITDTSTNYYGLKLTENFNNFASRVTVVGNFHDIGTINPKNNVDGVQRSEEVFVQVTNPGAIQEVLQREFPDQAQDKSPATLGGPLHPITNTTVNAIANINFGGATNLIRSGTAGILDSVISAPNAYFENLTEAQLFLAVVGQEYLTQNSRPKLFGSVNYHDQIPEIGSLVKIRLNELGIDMTAIVASTSISGMGSQQGNDEQGNRKYTYSVDLSDFNYHLQFPRTFYINQFLRIRPNRNIKPLPPDIINYLYNHDGSQPTLILDVRAATSNAPADQFGNTQPTLPPIQPNRYECRLTVSSLALTDIESPQIYWMRFSVQSFHTGREEVHLEDPNELFNEAFNIYKGEVTQWRIQPVPNNETLFLQVRTISHSEVASDWGLLKEIQLGESKDQHDNPSPAPPGALDGVDQTVPVDCCGSTPVTPPSPPPPTPPANNNLEATYFIFQGDRDTYDLPPESTVTLYSDSYSVVPTLGMQSTDVKSDYYIADVNTLVGTVFTVSANPHAGESYVIDSVDPVVNVFKATYSTNPYATYHFYKGYRFMAHRIN